MENIGIITYPFISGLYYLADSFRVYQERLGNKVFMIPKKSFVFTNNRWTGIFKYEMDNFLLFKNDLSYNLQVINYIKKYNIKKIFSFETFMRDSLWVNTVSNLGVQVIDIPMPEWSLKSDLYGGKYSNFFEVYCLTDQAFSLFKNFSNAKKITWDFCPDIFDIKKEKNNILTFYHPGSNYINNQKNTSAVIESIKLIPYKNIKLIISGMTDSEIKDDRIIFLGQKKSRHEIYNAYLKADCIISPSTREGLGMCLFEARKFGCDIITSDADPMRVHSNYLCKVTGYNQSDSLIPFAIIDPPAIADQINKYYEDFYGTK
jgi:glycosyltransferase involved in cell wall biosynthesis